MTMRSNNTRRDTVTSELLDILDLLAATSKLHDAIGSLCAPGSCSVAAIDAVNACAESKLDLARAGLLALRDKILCGVA